jgi:hypothetical protein
MVAAKPNITWLQYPLYRAADIILLHPEKYDGTIIGEAERDGTICTSW